MAVGDGYEVPVRSKNLLQLVAVDRETVFFKSAATDGHDGKSLEVSLM